MNFLRVVVMSYPSSGLTRPCLYLLTVLLLQAAELSPVESQVYTPLQPCAPHVLG